MGANREALTFKNSGRVAGAMTLMNHRVHTGFRYFVAGFKCLFSFRCAFHACVPVLITQFTKAELDRLMNIWQHFYKAPGTRLSRLFRNFCLIHQQHGDAISHRVNPAAGSALQEAPVRRQIKRFAALRHWAD